MNSKDIKLNDKIWDQVYLKYQKNSTLGVRYPNEHLVRFINEWKNSGNWPSDRRPRVLEFGFANITNMVMMSHLGCDVEGFEVSDESVKRARQSISDLNMENSLTVNSYTGGADIPRPDGYYEAIIGLQCVYYNSDQQKFSENCSRVLRVGGCLFLSFFSRRHGYMNHINGNPGGVVEFNDSHPNSRLVGLTPFLYRNKSQFNDTYGQFFEISVGYDEFDLLPIFQSWYYLRGQKKDFLLDQKINFSLSKPSQFRIKKDLVEGFSAKDGLLDSNISIWSKYANTIPNKKPFSGNLYPDEQLVRFLATWKRRRRNDYFSNIGEEYNDSIVEKGRKALEINPLNPVNLEAMSNFGYDPYGITYIPHSLSVLKEGLDNINLSDKSVNIDLWNGRNIPHDDKKFSCVVSTKAAYYQPDQVEFSKEVSRVLSDDGEICMFYLSPEHGYCNYIESVEGNLYRFTSKHPNKELVGCIVFLANSEDLKKIWSEYFDIQVKYFEFNTHNIFSKFYVVFGKKKLI